MFRIKSYWERKCNVFAFHQIITALTFIGNLMTQLGIYVTTPVGGTQTITFPPDKHVLEVSEGGEHWTVVGVTVQRVK